MIDTKSLIDNLENGPVILQNLLCPIPQNLMKNRRKKGKWSIHEHACHIVKAEEVLLSRFEKFANEEMPFFDPYCAPNSGLDDSLLQLNLDKELERFVSSRSEMIKLIRGFHGSFWNKHGIHDEYVMYNPYILLRHALMHENFHMYRIEELWITKDEYLG
ncbi:MAG: hypothetical protein ACJA2S_005438 [Cyclobacteriaceae bacterium]|jgi:hypothetical protein